MTKKKKLLISFGIFAGIIFLICASLVACLYFGVILLNNPSKELYPVRGVDVSAYQGEINWLILSEEDIDFAFIKATEGSGHQDRYFKTNLICALESKLVVGAYHFFSFDSAGSTQAENFINEVPIVDGMLPPVVDVEFYDNKAENPPPKETVIPQLLDLLNALEENYGVTPIIYTTEGMYLRYVKALGDKYHIWIRDVKNEPNTNAIPDWKFWQYTNREHLDGYDGKEWFIDMNVFNGSVNEFNDFDRVKTKTSL